MRGYVLVDYEVGHPEVRVDDADIEWPQGPRRVGRVIALRPPQSCIVYPGRTELPSSRVQGAPEVALLGSCHDWIVHFTREMQAQGMSVIPWRDLVVEEQVDSSVFAAAGRLGADALVVWGEYSTRIGGIDGNTPARLRYRATNHRGEAQAALALSLSDRDALRRLVAERIDRIGTWDRDRVAYELATELSAFDVATGQPLWRMASRKAWVLDAGIHRRRFLFRGRAGHFRPVLPKTAAFDARGPAAGRHSLAHAGRLGTGEAGVDPSLQFLSEESLGQSHVPGEVGIVRINRQFAQALALALGRALGSTPSTASQQKRTLVR